MAAGEKFFDVLPERRQARRVQFVVFALFGLAALALSLIGPWGWIGWLVGGALLGLAAGRALSLIRMRHVARVAPEGVTVWLPSGREMRLAWREIEAHTIDPEKRLGGLVVRAGRSGRVRIIPVSTADMGPEAARTFLAALKQHLPKLEYRLPTLGRR